MTAVDITHRIAPLYSIPEESAEERVMVRTEIRRPDREHASIREIDWNDRSAVHCFSRAARHALLAGGEVISRRI